MISAATIRSLAENINCTSAVPSHELAGDVFNKIVVVHVARTAGCGVRSPNRRV
jgi:hypothetical protein